MGDGILYVKIDDNIKSEIETGIEKTGSKLQLARAIGYSQAKSINNILNGTRKMHPDKYLRLKILVEVD